MSGFAAKASHPFPTLHGGSTTSKGSIVMRIKLPRFHAVCLTPDSASHGARLHDA